MNEGQTCYERDETFCEDQMCLRVGCRLQNARVGPIRQDGEGMTEFTVRRLRAEIILQELEDLAENFEGAGPDAPWTGREIANQIRDRIKNHPAVS